MSFDFREVFFLDSLQTATDENYFNFCHDRVLQAQSQSYLLKVGLYLYIDSLNIGYDVSTSEIILPVDETHYQPIKLNFDRAANEKDAQRVLQHYNLKPYEMAKWHLHKDETGKLVDGGNNYDTPYRDDSPFARLNAEIQTKIKERRNRYARYRSRVGFC